jgi:hypothetical protein
MGETSVYYVPKNQDACSGRSQELADKMWNLGVFLQTPEIMERVRSFRESGTPLPECKFDLYQKFGDMGIADEMDEHPVPNYVYDIKCPSCEADVMDATYEAWGSDSEVSPKQRSVTCPSCGASHAARDLQFGQPMTFARFYVFVSDCEQDEWDPNFRKTLEGIVGPCSEFWEWST